MNALDWLFVLAGSLVCAENAYVFAKQNDYNPYFAFFLGLLTGWLGLAVLYLVKRSLRRSQKNASQGVKKKK